MSDDFNPAYWVWGHEATQPRMLHTMVRVKDLEKTIKFYTEGLGMKLLDRFDFEAGKFSLAYLGYAGYDEGGVIELTYNWDQKENYTHGSGYGHMAIGVPDIHGTVEHLKSKGARITVEPKHQAPGAPMLAFVEDPDGYQVELIQTRYESAS